jgi:hypothetical protein
MIAVPTVPSTKPSAVAAMSCTEEWPSLSGTVSQLRDDMGTDATAEGDDWEMLSPAESEHLDDSGDEVVPEIPRPLKVARKNSISAPELSALGVDAETAEEDYSVLDNQSESVVMVNTTGSVASSGVMVQGPPAAANPWLNKNKVSFRDAILTPSKYVPAQKLQHGNEATQLVKSRVKSRFVVTPIKRCAKSTGDLLALAAEEEEHEVLGESDAMEYYQRKSHGAHGHNNGMKLRPDEAKRKVMIVEKKNSQCTLRRWQSNQHVRCARVICFVGYCAAFPRFHQKDKTAITQAIDIRRYPPINYIMTFRIPLTSFSRVQA